MGARTELNTAVLKGIPCSMLKRSFSAVWGTICAAGNGTTSGCAPDENKNLCTSFLASTYEM